MELSIVTGTYNRLKLLQRMIESVRGSMRDLSYEIILVDGGSTDGTIDWCKKQPNVVLIEQGKLLGAVKAFNAGCKVARGEFVCILNDDITVRDDTIWRSWQYLREHPEVGQVAYRNHPVKEAAEPRSSYSRSYGYLYGQCCLTRRWLGDLAGWWGTTYHTYGGDSRLGMRMWELGYEVHGVNGCGITDYVFEDQMRIDRRKLLRPGGHGTPHKDTEAFIREWDHRLPRPADWIPNPVARLAHKAALGNLKSIRFRFVYPGAEMRMAQFNAFKRLGPTWHFNHCDFIDRHGVGGFQQDVTDIVEHHKPDIVMFQAHGSGNIQPQTVRDLREKHPNTYFTNFDGDFHNPLTGFHFEIAKACHLQMLISPDLFPIYAQQGIYNVCWSYPGYEEEYAEVERPDTPDGPIVFLVNKTPSHVFPDAPLRNKTVEVLHKSGLPFKVYGSGWGYLGIHTECTSRTDERAKNAQIYADAQMAVSVSQAHDLYGYVSNRIFFAGATGCPVLQKTFNGMEDMGFVDGETVIAWDDHGEMLDKIHYYRMHRDESEEIGCKCREMVLERHSYDMRIQQLLLMLEGISSE